jgi:hypothetical protein
MATLYTKTIIEEGLHFILGHFEEPIWPRPISTYARQDRQIEVISPQAALNLYEYAKFLDCKIRAFPSYLEWDGLNRQAPNLIFIDLDLLRFNSKQALDRTLNKTLENIKDKMDNAYPTVIWSGNGYHIYQSGPLSWKKKASLQSSTSLPGNLYNLRNNFFQTKSQTLVIVSQCPSRIACYEYQAVIIQSRTHQ